MSNTSTTAEPDYQKLREILEREFCRSVPLKEAKLIGKHLISTYYVLLGDEL